MLKWFSRALFELDRSLDTSEYFLLQFFTNFFVFFVVYSISYLVVYVWLKEYLRSRKIDDRFPSNGLVAKELFRCISSVFVLTIEDAMMFKLWKQGKLFNNLSSSPDILETHKFWVVVLAILSIAWGETHFYWTHRLLHSIPILYKRVHKVHHESLNPDPFSGMSFHPVEAAIYFSALPGLTLFPSPLPYWLYRLFAWGLILGPCFVHLSYDVPIPSISISWSFQPTFPFLFIKVSVNTAERFTVDRKDASVHRNNAVLNVGELGFISRMCYRHYVHHSKYSMYPNGRHRAYNFGGFPMWDRICGTEYDPVAKRKKKE